MSLTHITTLSQLDGILSKSKDKLSVIDFHATWCGPCHMIAPVYAALAQKHPDVNFLKCDVDAAKDVASRYRVTAMPTFVFLKGNTQVDQVRGADKAALEAAVKKHSAGSAPSPFSGKGHTLGSSSSPAASPATPTPRANLSWASGFSDLSPPTKTFLYLLAAAQTAGYTTKWILVDTLYCACLSQLRIPRLNYTKSIVVLQILLLCISDAFLFGGITLNLGLGGGSWKIVTFGSSGSGEVISTGSSSGIVDYVPGLGSLFGSGGSHDHNLLGQHTVRMSPIATAHLNPQSQTFCLTAPGQSILIPVVLNNTSPTSLRYTLTPLGYSPDAADREKSKSSSQPRVERIELSTKDLKSIEQARLDSLQVARVTLSGKRDAEDYDEYDDDDDDDTAVIRSSSTLQKTQSMAHIRLNKPGVLRLERVIDNSGVEARLVYPTEVTVAPCPRFEFVDDGALALKDDIRCAAPGFGSGTGEELQLSIHIFGVPPLSLRWSREVNSRRESFMVEGIEEETKKQSQDEGRRAAGAGLKAAQQLTVPLTISLDALGTHTYVLESVTDALGNLVTRHSLPSEGSSDAKLLRTTSVLRRPTVSFRGCGAGNPVPLLIGQDAPVTISTKASDAWDAPWDVTVQYTSFNGDDKRFKPWNRTLTTSGASKDITLRAIVPGEYSIVGIKGKYCEGDVLSPDVCSVVEKPHPTATIEWKKIHECSGDTGVSASLIMHGTAPFQVYYSMQRDKETPKEIVKTFPNSRGELTIQPERSGHYTFTFLQLSDANYKKIPLNGPSIDQVVHPPASVDFSHKASAGRAKKRISSCSGNSVDVNVELRGTGPWNLEVQVGSTKGSEIIHVKNITSERKTLQIAIPAAIDKVGGSFDIDLVSVEDAYGCKRTVTVPGVSVNVRRVKPTAKFYGTKERRQITILEGERASLPLRLTGDGPWEIKYKRAEFPAQLLTATLNSPNDELQVAEKGTYQIHSISDSQCPGAVDSEAFDYAATYVAYNGSHILPPICEGLPDHVDLDLTGKPPFQIMYNVAKDSEVGGTKILDQPTFSSIQPRTRFQLHTSEAARIYYEVKQIGDAAYPLAKNRNAVIPRSGRLLFEQQVLMRPSARFKTSSRLSYCMNDVLSPHDAFSQDGLVLLEGTPPFQLKLSIKNLAASEVHYETIQVNEYAWKMDVPSYTLKSIGPHLVTIESISDASHCEQAIPDPLFRSIWADVAETAAIVPFDRREHFCVGEMSQFQLEGTPPWTVGYRVNTRSAVQEVQTSPFSIVQKQPGDFVITSIAHQHKMCKTAVTDLRYIVHPLPSAQVGHGARIIQDIHEGDQAEIVFTLIGEPPFTFTYQRTELSTKKGVAGKVLETHTVSGVTAKEYSIFSALEGACFISLP
ncbi:hypothetical protein EUX98_g778 [Antrodiella citrinella]|uniref:Thioredoxin domain-containing protein n=1 Tax=Antrodiella citrinella TaxID=2447956 RepID=A0A4S4N347_9APHY|nr:hypothetical protein EUX98_g778 [Antrodiella citrinella]